MKKSVQIKCPTCRREGDWFAGPYGPFCSWRCKLVDLGVAERGSEKGANDSSKARWGLI